MRTTGLGSKGTHMKHNRSLNTSQQQCQEEGGEDEIDSHRTKV